MFNFLKKPGKGRVFVLGLDGVPCSLLKRFIEDGVMPQLGSIVREGRLMPMQVSLPEVSSTSWTTFMTGVNPGRHGIYGFMDIKTGTRDLYFPKSSDIKSPAVWDISGKHGKRSVILNVPSTYPARSINGVLTAGFVSPDLEKGTYPKRVYEYLRDIDYKMDVEVEGAARDPDAFKKEVDFVFAKRQEAFKFILDHEEWDIFIAAVTETDRLHHFFFEAFADKSHPMHGYLLDFYRKIDALAGYFYKKAKEKSAAFIVMSDHGFTAVKHEIYLNGWLRQSGYLRFKTEPPGSLSDIDPQSRAFALDPSRIYINLEGRYAEASVPQNDYAALREKIKQELLKFKIDDEEVIKEVFFKEEVYAGPCLESAPDIILLANHGFDLKGTIRKKEIFGKGVFTGAHTRDDAVLFIDRKIDRDGIHPVRSPAARGVTSNGVNIVDIAPSILAYLGLPQEAKSLDGKIIF